MVKTIFVTGASGQLGQLIVQHLVERADFGKTFKVIAGSRTPEKLEALAAKGVETRKLDLEDVHGTEAAFKGVDRLILISTDNFGKRYAAHKVAIDSAVKNGVKHVVYTSFGNPAPDRPLYDEHYYTEAYLAAATNIGFSILRNGLYAEILVGALTHSLPAGEWKTATGTNKRSYTARDDLALATAIISSSVTDETSRRLYELTAEELYTGDEVAKIVTEVTGKPLKHVAITDEQLIAIYASHLPQHVSEALAELDKHTRLGFDNNNTGQLRQVLGRAPTSLKDFLTANKAALEPKK